VGADSKTDLGALTSLFKNSEQIGRERLKRTSANRFDPESLESGKRQETPEEWVEI
jgi:hypothetical protein